VIVKKADDGFYELITGDSTLDGLRVKGIKKVKALVVNPSEANEC
jgi:hypothetical protein